MYNEPKSFPQQPPEHKAIALQFANEMLERFNPHECNEIILLIRQRWQEYRGIEIEKAEKHIAYLKDSMSNL